MMLKFIPLLSILLAIFVTTTACSNDNDSSNLNGTEKMLLGKWYSKKIIIEIPNEPTTEIYPTPAPICFMEFEKRDAALINQSSPIYSNTKFVQDNKDCSWLANAWKVEQDGKLLLASLDTVYADILKLTNDSLILKLRLDNYYGQENTHYVSTNTYYLIR